ncbi:MAG: hypothetical protein ACLUD0_09715 [Eubacterium ramulus]
MSVPVRCRRVYTVDLREELRNGNRSIFSDKLRELITDRLEKKEQIMLVYQPPRVWPVLSPAVPVEKSLNARIVMCR